MIPSCSGLERALACPASTVLPRGPDSGSEAAERGQALHGYVEAVANGAMNGNALQLVPEPWRAAARGLDVDAILEALGWSPFGATEMTAEQAFAWDSETDTARVLGAGLGRDYSAALPTEAVGTADVVVYDPDTRTVTVADYKFGHGEVARANRNAQLRSLALYAARAYGATSARVVIVRGREDGSAWLDTDVLSAEALDGIAAELRQLAARITSDRAKGTAKAVAGDHCRYCRSAPSCPLGPVALAVAQTSGLDRLAGTPEGRARLVVLQTLAKRLPDMIDDALRGAITRGETSLPDGAVLAIESTAKRKVGDAEAVYENVLVNLGREAAEIAAPRERSATVTSIKDAAKVGAARGQTTKAADDLLAHLTRQGLITTSESSKVVARKGLS